MYSKCSQFARLDTGLSPAQDNDCNIASVVSSPSKARAKTHVTKQWTSACQCNPVITRVGRKSAG